MLQLTISVDYNDCDCNVIITDPTNFVDINVDGFLRENQTPNGPGQFRISDGYMFNVLINTKYNGKSEIINSNELIYNIPSSLVQPVYQDNFPPTSYSLTTDGSILVRRFFIMSKTFYDNSPSSWFAGKTVVYYDGSTSKFYKVVGGSPVEISLLDLALEYNSSYTGSYYSFKIFSICYIRKCYTLLAKQIVDGSLGTNEYPKKSKCRTGNCNEYEEDLLSKRDFLHDVLHVLQYLIDCNYFGDAQRLLESLNTCGFICKDVGLRTNNDCGCGK